MNTKRCLKFLDKKNDITEQEIDSFEENSKNYADIVYDQSWDDSVYEHSTLQHLPKISKFFFFFFLKSLFFPLKF